MPTVYRSGITVTAALLPSLGSSISAAALTSTTARVSYTTSIAYGTVWVLVDTSPTQTPSTIRATGEELVNTVAGAQTHDVSGLNPSTTYYAHVYFEFGTSGHTRHSAAFNTPASGGGGGGVVYRSGITVTGPLDELVSVSDSTAGATVTFETGGAYDLEVDAPTVTYGGVALTDISVTDADTFTAVMPIDGFAFGSDNDFVVTVDGVDLGAISALFLSDLDAYVTLSVGYSELHPDSPLKRAEVADLYSGLVAGDQIPYNPLTAGTAAQPAGYAVSITSTGQAIITGASAEPEPVYVTFGLVDASDNYARSQDEDTSEYFSVWTLYTSIPNGVLTPGTPAATSTTATLPFTWTGTNATGFQYRIDGGSWTAIAGSPIALTGLTAETDYDYDVRPVNGTVPGDTFSGSFTTGAASGIDTTPDPITFAPVTGAQINTRVWSGWQPITGVSAGQDIDVSVTGDSPQWQYSTDGGANPSTATSDPGTVRLNYLVRVSTLTSSTYLDENTATLTAGGVPNVLSVTNRADDIAPVVTLIGPATVSVIQGTTWTDPGATATDNVDGSVSVVATGTVNTATIGQYTRTYTATDAAGNVGEAIRIINVVAAADASFIDYVPRLLTTDTHHITIYMDRDNTSRVTISHDGEAVDMASFTRFVLYGLNTAPLDSTDNPEAFDTSEGSGVLDMALGAIAETAGVKRLTLVAYSAGLPNGVVLFEPSLAGAHVNALVMIA